MITYLHLVEGLPASGKSTTAKKLYEKYSSNQVKSKYYKEETSQPVDLFRQALLNTIQYECFLLSCKKICDEIKVISYETIKKNIIENSYKLEDIFVIAYTVLDCFSILELKQLFYSLSKYDSGDGRIDFSMYQSLRLKVLNRFVQDVYSPDTVYITEGAFLHNQLLDIIGFYDLTDEEIIRYFGKQFEIIAQLHPIIYFIYPDDFEKLIKEELLERGCEKGSWGAGFHNWIKYSNFGIKNNLSGVEGMNQLYEEMFRISNKIISELDIPVHYIKRITK